MQLNRGATMIRYYLPGSYLQVFWVSLVLAGVLFFLMALNRKTRPALLYPIVLALVGAGPYLMFLCGTPISNREAITVYRALFAAPWIFVLTSAVVAPIYYSRATRHAGRTSAQDGGEPRLFWGMNLIFPFAVLLTAIPYVANSDWLYMVKPFRDSIFSQGHTIRFLLLSVLVNYFVVAAVAAAALYGAGFFRWFNPAAYGRGPLLVTNVLELIRALLIAYFIYAWRDESFFIRVSEVNQLFIWPLRFAEALSIAAIVLSNVVNANRSLQPGTLAHAAE